MTVTLIFQLELDWSHLDAVAENVVAAQEAARVVTETTPLVDPTENVTTVGDSTTDSADGTNSTPGNGNHPIDPSG
ncbi:unnamed protein product [Haemonchus placei]|uniref:ATPase n=1 Tax=Haemonchus placei TaxID=6290 RepID=A0A0N4VTT5_HAEPC|nr:unnamed protein product [Haemonchus placei]